MTVNVGEVIEYMKKWNKKVMSLKNGWNIKEIRDHQEYEVFNDEETQIYNCTSEKNLEDILKMIK